MSDCQHIWDMTNIQFGFVVFEKCTHCNGLRTYFSEKDHPIVNDSYREDNCEWKCVENAQSFRFDLKCKKCNQVEQFKDVMGFLYCTGCMHDCKIEILQKEYEPKKQWILVAFGYLPKDKNNMISEDRLLVIEEYFNQRRDTSRSTMKILSSDLIENFSQCKGYFIHDVGMLSLEPPGERKHLL